MNGWRKVAFRSLLPSLPPSDQVWFVSAPIVHGPERLSSPTVGPMPHCSPAKRSFVAVGSRKIGPTPQHQPLSAAFVGDRKKLCAMSPSPVSERPSLCCLMNGTTERE